MRAFLFLSLSRIRPATDRNHDPGTLLVEIHFGPPAGDHLSGSVARHDRRPIAVVDHPHYPLVHSDAKRAQFVVDNLRRIITNGQGGKLFRVAGDCSCPSPRNRGEASSESPLRRD
jgi:hypothetical protein